VQQASQDVADAGRDRRLAQLLGAVTPLALWASHHANRRLRALAEADRSDFAAALARVGNSLPAVARSAAAPPMSAALERLTGFAPLAPALAAAERAARRRGAARRVVDDSDATGLVAALGGSTFAALRHLATSSAADFVGRDWFPLHWSASPEPPPRPLWTPSAPLPSHGPRSGSHWSRP